MLTCETRSLEVLAGRDHGRRIGRPSDAGTSLSLPKTEPLYPQGWPRTLFILKI